MNVDVREADSEVIIVDLEGRLVAGTGDEVLRDVVNELLAEGWKKIVLNLSEVSKIDSAGIGELVASTRLAERFASKITLVNVQHRVRHILELSQIAPLLAIFESEDAALAAFA